MNHAGFIPEGNHSTGTGICRGSLYHYFQGQLMGELKKEADVYFRGEWKVPGRII